MADAPLRVLILSASIGEGHDLPAKVLADGIRAQEPGAEIEIRDFLEIVSPAVRRVVMGGSAFHSKIGAVLFDFEFWMITKFRPTIWLARKLFWLFAKRRSRRALAEARPDVIVATYPGASEILGELRRRGLLEVPTASAITDLAALRYWAHPGIDLHLITHPESDAEVRAIAPQSRIECVRDLTDSSFYEPRDEATARAALELPAGGPLVLVSGGGWGVGDLTGAAEAVLAEDGATALCLCGRNDEVRESLSNRFEGEDRVIVRGFTDRMAELMAASDVLVHSTAGLTVLEAIMSGCRVVSYGFGHGHIRVNNEAYARFGLARVAADREQLRVALHESLAEPRSPDRSFEALPGAASLVLAISR